jgi:hypothetical protein
MSATTVPTGEAHHAVHHLFVRVQTATTGAFTALTKMTEDTEPVKITGEVTNTGTHAELRTVRITGNAIKTSIGTTITGVTNTGTEAGKGIAGILTAG